MKTGIYKLNFAGTDKVYIGQSVDIIKRYSAHLRSFKDMVASKKLQEAYNTYGPPSLDIILECSETELDENEIIAIDIYNSYDNGFNTLTGGSSGNGQCGELTSNALYTNNDYKDILRLLAKDISVFDIANTLQVSESVVRSIKKCENHRWLQKELPIEYNIVLEKHIKYTQNKNNAEFRGITYPLIVNIKTGEKIIVTNLRDTARLLELDSGNLSRLLNEKATSYKGFILEKNYNKLKAIKVISPLGIVYGIPYKGLSEFARTHQLNKSSLSNLVNKKWEEYKGWKLYSDR